MRFICDCFCQRYCLVMMSQEIFYSFASFLWTSLMWITRNMEIFVSMKLFQCICAPLTQTLCPDNRHGTEASTNPRVYFCVNIKSVSIDRTTSKWKKPEALCTLAVKCMQRATVSTAHCCQHDCTGQHLSLCNTRMVALVLIFSVKRTGFLKFETEPFVFPLFYSDLVHRSQWRQIEPFLLCASFVNKL